MSSEESPPITPTASSPDEGFPLNTKVLLTDLKTAEFNGKQGVIKSEIKDGRYQVLVGKKFLGLKPTNLKYEVRPVDSLSLAELKSILSETDENVTGMDVSDLRKQVSAFEGDAAFRLLATANAKQEVEKAKTRAAEEKRKRQAASSNNNNNHRNQADQIGNMNPDQLRQQARMMRSMPPDQIRRMNPQLARMTDAQLQAAATQMEQMADNPAMLRMAADQVKNMSPQELQRAQQQQAAAGGMAAPPRATTPEGYGVRAAPPTPQAAMDQMNPDQLKQQAQMMRSMPKDQIRALNPQLAGMSDAQIEQSIVQMEQMAANPGMLEMARSQMANMSPEDMRNLQAGQAPTGNNNPGEAAMDPAKMLETMDGKQLKSMMKMLKENPDMVKGMLPPGTDPKALAKSLEMFDGMNDEQMDKAIKMMRGVSNVTAPVRNAYSTVNNKLCGGHLLKVFLLIAIGYTALFVYLRFFVSDADASPSPSLMEEVPNIVMEEAAHVVQEEQEF